MHAWINSGHAITDIIGQDSDFNVIDRSFIDSIQAQTRQGCGQGGGKQITHAFLTNLHRRAEDDFPWWPKMGVVPRSHKDPVRDKDDSSEYREAKSVKSQEVSDR